MVAHNNSVLLAPNKRRSKKADKCSSCRIEHVLFQLIQTAHAFRSDYSRIESAALGRTQLYPAAIADQQQDLSVELLPSGGKEGLQSGAIKVLRFPHQQ